MRSFIAYAAVIAGLSANLVAAQGNSPPSNRTKPIFPDFPGQGPLPTLADLTKMNASTGHFLPLSNIQSDVFAGMRKPLELFYFFHINTASTFKTALKTKIIPLVTSTITVCSPPANQPQTSLNMAFSATGMTALGITDNLNDTLFSAGQFADATGLGDVVANWDSAFAGTNIHGVFLIASDNQTMIDSFVKTLEGYLGTSTTAVTTLQGSARPGSYSGHEHFGYLDGISNPAVDGFSTTVLPGQSLIPNGTILMGRTGDPFIRPSWALDGTFLVFRKLHQLVPEFNAYLSAHALTTDSVGTKLATTAGAELLGARMVGRWKSGAPVDLSPLVDNPTLGANIQMNNNFNFNHTGSDLASDQSECPFSSHIRKVRPRADLGDTNTINQAIRAGIPYGPEVTTAETTAGTTTQKRGLAFVEYQSSIANGFRRQQVVWANNAAFPPGKNVTVGLDAIIGQGGNAIARSAAGLLPNNFATALSIPEFIKAQGGEYFFMPSIPTLTSKIAV